jgi:hypothetical protein
VSNETHFVREETIADILECNAESALSVLAKFISAFAKREETTISFYVSAVGLHLDGTIQLSLDGIKFGFD